MGALADLIYGIRTIAQGGTDKTLRGRLNFVSGATCTDNPATGSTDVVVSGASPTVPTGTGVMSVTAGVIDAASRLITNAYVDAAAAIAGSKIAPNFGSQALTAGASVLTSVRATALGTGVVHSDGSGNMTSSTLVNADVNASAAIVASKLDLTSIAQAIVNTLSITTAGLINTAGKRETTTTITQADSPYTLTNAKFAIAINHGAAVAINLPTSPAVGDTYEFLDVARVCATYNVTITAGTGHTIDGAATLVMNVNAVSYKIRCWDITTTNKWKIV